MGKMVFSLALVSMSGMSYGQYQAITQDRSIAAEAFVYEGASNQSEGDEDAREATSFDLFDARVGTTVDVNELQSGGEAWQYSIFGEHGVIASGSTSIALDRPQHEDSFIWADTESSLAVRFLILAPTFVRFDAEVSTLDDLLGVDLYNDDLSVVVSAGWNLNTEVEFEGQLPAGEYNLLASSRLYREANVGEGPASEQHDWSFFFRVVPGAPSLTVLGAAGVLASRRRRA
ncbi:MAG: hypothetical protein IT439_04415 [Phycisphaerales bacterium]|nr:hypothetical protein [Phycisphaerales bacterium]